MFFQCVSLDEEEKSELKWRKRTQSLVLKSETNSLTGVSLGSSFKKRWRKGFPQGKLRPGSLFLPLGLPAVCISSLGELRKGRECRVSCGCLLWLGSTLRDETEAHPATPRSSLTNLHSYQLDISLLLFSI